MKLLKTMTFNIYDINLYEAQADGKTIKNVDSNMLICCPCRRPFQTVEEFFNARLRSYGLANKYMIDTYCAYLMLAQPLYLTGNLLSKHILTCFPNYFHVAGIYGKSTRELCLKLLKFHHLRLKWSDVGQSIML